MKTTMKSGAGCARPSVRRGLLLALVILSLRAHGGDVPGLPQQQPVLRLNQYEAPIGTPNNPFLPETKYINYADSVLQTLAQQQDNPIPAWFMRFAELLIYWASLSDAEQRSINVAHLHGHNVWLRATGDSADSAERKISVYQIAYYTKIATDPDASKKPEFLLSVPESTPPAIKGLPVEERNRRIAAQYAEYYRGRLETLEKAAGVPSGQTVLLLKRIFGNRADFSAVDASSPPVAAQTPRGTTKPTPQSPHKNTENLPKGTGTGFFITDDGYLVTNHHVVVDGRKFTIVTAAGSFDARITKTDPDNDLALLKIESKSIPLPLAPSRSVKLGDTVATVGFPNVVLQGFSPKLGKGEIASLSGVGDDARYFQISVPVQPGNSGGALVDELGNVVGVVSAKLSAKAALATVGALPENVNYAIKSSYLLSLLESVPDVAAKLKQPVTQDQKFVDVVQVAEKAAAFVLVY